MFPFVPSFFSSPLLPCVAISASSFFHLVFPFDFFDFLIASLNCLGRATSVFLLFLMFSPSDDTHITLAGWCHVYGAYIFIFYLSYNLFIFILESDYARKIRQLCLCIWIKLLATFRRGELECHDLLFENLLQFRRGTVAQDEENIISVISLLPGKAGQGYFSRTRLKRWCDCHYRFMGHQLYPRFVYQPALWRGSLTLL